MVHPKWGGTRIMWDDDGAIISRHSPAQIRAKRNVVQSSLREASQSMLDNLKIHDLDNFSCLFSRDGIVFLHVHGPREVNNWGDDPQSIEWEKCDEHWDRLLSKGLAVEFKLDWCDSRYANDDPRALRRGEEIFHCMQSAGLNPAWNGDVGDFTITALDKDGARLALAMALKPRLGSNSRLSLVSSLALSLARIYSELCSLVIVETPEFGCGRLNRVWCGSSPIWRWISARAKTPGAARGERVHS